MTKPHPFQTLLENIGHEVRSYRGRGMSPDERCLAVTPVGSFGSLLAEIVGVTADLARQDEDYDVEAVQSALRRMRTDTLGLGQIIYFPGVPYVE